MEFSFLKNILVLILYVCVYLSVGMWSPWSPEKRGLQTPRAGVPGGCELPNTGAAAEPWFSARAVHAVADELSLQLLGFYFLNE